MDASLRRKLLSVVVLITLVCLPPVVVGLVLDRRLDDARAATREATEAVITVVELQETSLIRGGGAVQSYTISGFSEPEYVEDYRAAAAEVPELVARLEDQVPDELDEPVAAVADAQAAAIASFDDVVSLDPDTADPDAPAADVPVLLEAASAASGDAFAAHTVLGIELSELVVERRDEVDRLQGQLVWATLASLVLALAAAAGGIYIVTNGIVRRIELLSANASRFIQNEQVTAVPKSRDEIGRLSASMSYAGELLDARRSEALAATRAKDDFLSRVSHELKTPLTAMIGFGQLLEEDDRLPPESRDDASHIVRAGHHLHELIQELLDIGAIESGKLDLVLEPVPVRDPVDEAVALVQPMAADRSITVATDCPPGIVVTADRRRLREVMLNLLSNAIKYNRESGRVDLTAERHDSVVRVSVTDTGPGISPTDQARLFTPFERLDAARTDVEGSGVGLALTKNVVETMGGTIGVDSTVGHGSTFWVDLPVSGDQRHAPAPPPTATRSPGA